MMHVSCLEMYSEILQYYITRFIQKYREVDISLAFDDPEYVVPHEEIVEVSSRI